MYYFLMLKDSAVYTVNDIFCIYMLDSSIVIIIYISLHYIVIYISYMLSTQFFVYLEWVIHLKNF